MTWLKLKDKEPNKRELCDFLFPETDEEDGDLVWMLCSAFYFEVFEYGDPVYWRKAEQLPEDLIPTVQVGQQVGLD